MNDGFIRDLLWVRFRDYGLTLEQAAQDLIREMSSFGAEQATIHDAVWGQVRELQDEAAANILLTRPRGVHDPYYAYDRQADSEVREAHWYDGRTSHDYDWPHLKHQWQGSSLEQVVHVIEEESRRITAHLANPNVPGLRKKGLVVGHVQSGKTANYSAVMASAGDAGYRLFIVLAGMHNGLRQQTQERLERDLLNDRWKPLTTTTADFGVVTDDSALFQQRGLRLVAVVKKNSSRLRRLRDWLTNVPLEVRQRCPALLIDDEADQATPNTRAAQDEASAINGLVRDVRRAIPTGTYLAYTATPFATVLLNPDDEEELYPSDFILDLERSEDYFGAERVFGREPLDSDEQPEPGLDMVRTVREEERVALRPPTDRHTRQSWEAPLPDSMRDAVKWFLLATATRRAREQRDSHSSMLIHTTHYVDAHFAQRERIEELLQELRTAWDEDLLRAHWAEETSRVPAHHLDEEPVSWHRVSAEIPRVLDSVRTVVDNGNSQERIHYGRRDAHGMEMPETVIAIGGNTLSRGLTLEGLSVSYFVRFSNTYDTLLQMGRWFGYWSGYSDLPRIWMPQQLEEDFRFLATVEHEIRVDMQRYEREAIRPRQLGLRIRTHPGRLAITARAKMHHAQPQQWGFGGTRRQTFILHEHDVSILRGNIEAARQLVSRSLREAGDRRTGDGGRAVFTGLPCGLILEFLRGYTFHPDHGELRSDLIEDWIVKRQETGRDSDWNLVVMSKRQRRQAVGDRSVDLGQLDLGLEEPVAAFNRAPLRRAQPGVANIKSLMSARDRVADLQIPPERHGSAGGEVDYAEMRKELAPSRGCLLLYPVSRHSVPMRITQGVRDPRREMEAPEHLLGVGLVFPHDDEGFDATYLSVQPQWDAEDPVEEISLPDDTEGEAEVDGNEPPDGTSL